MTPVRPILDYVILEECFPEVPCRAEQAQFAFSWSFPDGKHIVAMSLAKQIVGGFGISARREQESSSS